MEAAVGMHNEKECIHFPSRPAPSHGSGNLRYVAHSSVSRGVTGQMGYIYNSNVPALPRVTSCWMRPEYLRREASRR